MLRCDDFLSWFLSYVPEKIPLNAETLIKNLSTDYLIFNSGTSSSRRQSKIITGSTWQFWEIFLDSCDMPMLCNFTMLDLRDSNMINNCTPLQIRQNNFSTFVKIRRVDQYITFIASWRFYASMIIMVRFFTKSAYLR